MIDHVRKQPKNHVDLLSAICLLYLTSIIYLIWRQKFDKLIVVNQYDALINYKQRHIGSCFCLKLSYQCVSCSLSEVRFEIMIL